MSTLAYRRAAATVAMVTLAAASVVAATALPARAYTASVDNAADFKQAVNDASTAGPGDHVITISEGFTWDDHVPAYYDGVGNLAIEGSFQTITMPEASFAFLLVFADDAANIDIRNLSFTGSPESVFTIQGNSVLFENVHMDDMDLTYAAITASVAGDVQIVNSTFTDISASAGAAAVADIGAQAVYIADSTFTRNSGPFNGKGALRIVSQQTNWIDDSRFESNSSTTDGGAVSLVSGSLVANGSTFINNEADRYGGAIYAEDGSVQVFTSSFEGNTAYRGGGIWSHQYSKLDASLFTGNQAQDMGGGVYIGGNHAYMTSVVWSSTFHGNHAGQEGVSGIGYGGAIFVEQLDLFVDMSTFTDNGAGASGAHVAQANAWFHPFGSVFADARDGAGCWPAGSVHSDGHNVDDDGACSSFWASTGDTGFETDPQLGALSDNGGPTHTRMPAPTSPLVDAIPLETCEDMLQFSNAAWDQRELPRTSVAARDGGCDIGAVERVGAVSFTLEGPSGEIEFVVEGAYDYYGECERVDDIADAPAGAPAGVAFPHGLLSFCVATGIPGTTVTVHVTFPSPLNRAYKVDEGWVEIPRATYAGNTLTYQVTDGGPLDRDGDEDGYILDPLAAGVAAAFTG